MHDSTLEHGFDKVCLICDVFMTINVKFVMRYVTEFERLKVYVCTCFNIINPCSAGIDFSRQNMTSTDVIF